MANAVIWSLTNTHEISLIVCGTIKLCMFWNVNYEILATLEVDIFMVENGNSDMTSKMA